MKILYICLGLLLGFALMTSAYTVNIARPMNKSIEIKQTPNNIILDQRLIKILNNMHCSGQASAYQAGCNDGIDMILERIGIRENKFRRGPSTSLINPILNDSITFKLNGSFILLNTSMYKIEYWNNKSYTWKQFNYSYPGNISMNGIIRLWVK